MSASVDNLALNKKGTKVVITGKPKYYNLLGTTIQYGIPIGCIAYQYDIFSFNESGYSATGWGLIVAIISFLAFRSKIKEAFKEYDKSLGTTWNRSKAGSVSLIIASVLLLVSVFTTALYWVFYSFAISTYLALFFYKPYDELAEKKAEMQAMLDSKTKTADFEKLTQKFNELQNQKTL